MIHIFHTSATELARKRIRLAVRCLPCVLVPIICTTWWAWHQVRYISCGDASCDFQGVLFHPVPDLPPEKTSVHIQIPETESIRPQQLVLALPEMEMPEFDFEEQEPDLPEEHLDVPEEEVEITASAPAVKKNTASPAPAASRYTPPAYLNCPHPNYPPRLRQRRVEGAVGVSIMVSSEGIPEEVHITASSGSDLLDRHTRSWILRNWRFSPAQKEGAAVASIVATSIHYQLQ